MSIRCLSLRPSLPPSSALSHSLSLTHLLSLSKARQGRRGRGEGGDHEINASMTRGDSAGPKTLNNENERIVGGGRGKSEGEGELTPCSSPRKSWERRGISCQRCILISRKVFLNSS